MVLRRDGSMHVRETIEYDFAGTPDRHGIRRFIPVQFPYDDEHRRVYPVDDVRAASPSGAPADVALDEGPTLVVQVGDRDRTVEGVQTYVLDYDVRGVVNSFENRQELYWNAVGTQWEVPVRQARVTVEGPAPIDRVACYEGPQASTQPCRAARADRGIGRFAASDLAPGEAMTVVTAFPARTFPDAAPLLEEIWSVQRAFALTPVTGAGALGVLGVLGGWAVAHATRRGRDEEYLGVTPGLEPGLGQESAVSRVGLLRRAPVAVQFTPPRDMRPGQLPAVR